MDIDFRIDFTMPPDLSASKAPERSMNGTPLSGDPMGEALRLAYVDVRRAPGQLTPFDLLDLSTADVRAVVGAPFAVIGSGAFSSEIDMGSWTFCFASQTADTNILSSILIVKNDDAESVLTLAGCPDLWGAIGNANVRQTSAWLVSYLEAAITVANGSEPLAPFYSGFARRVQDPVWRGFIVINPLCRPDTVLPPDLAWLATMVNPSLSFIHHLGGDWDSVLQNVWSEGRTLTPLFATIDYSTAPPSSVTSENGVYLRVRFENNALVTVETSPRLASYGQEHG